ncbi:hypothetical protein FISHEDRAFT_37011 [Fistulina hepatica ATCC 64428]|uniref:LysM domain-containing protein n=1 Tax=Fistulina hepatica ATCC 64428 TaxID=1128425 RepID=A0A0D7AL71_9AGAR|nr:hypothetical protein FISHEDRAFT_37011 [Fistulina hepatica ATCC 64428]
MGRWTQYDEDDYRLPEGMTRIGYDADSGRYSFRDRDGSVWEGPQGAEFGEMTRVSGPEPSTNPHADAGDVEAGDNTFPPSTRADGYHSLAPMAETKGVNAQAYRQLMPFFLFIGVVLLLAWKFILAPALSRVEEACPGLDTYWVEPGDTCWNIAQAHGSDLDTLVALNPTIDCARLMPGATICLPVSPATTDTI